ncbi:MAG: IclR family transcriptional regulator [Lachnospiraceae bacterium]
MTDSKNPIQVADRIFRTIELLAQTGPMGLLDLSHAAELNKSTMHRILLSLISMGYVKQDPVSLHYSLTFKVWDIANQMLTKIDILEIARPYLKHLVEITGETVHLVQRDGIHAVYIDKVESYTNSVRMVSTIGKSVPLYCSGVGKALLAEMEPAAVKTIWNNSKIEKLTAHTITDYQTLTKRLVQVRERGYALDEEENELGVRCIAVSIRDYTGQSDYAFSISAPSSRMSEHTIQELAVQILAVRKQLENSWR